MRGLSNGSQSRTVATRRQTLSLLQPEASVQATARLLALLFLCLSKCQTGLVILPLFPELSYALPQAMAREYFVGRRQRQRIDVLVCLDVSHSKSRSGVNWLQKQCRLPDPSSQPSISSSRRPGRHWVMADLRSSGCTRSTTESPTYSGYCPTPASGLICSALGHRA